jgi:hypothetical protein
VAILGLNSSRAIRQQAFPDLPTGAASIRWNSERPLPEFISTTSFGILAFLRQTVKTDPSSGWAEKATSLVCYLIEPGKSPQLLEGIIKAELMRGIFNATVRTKVEDCSQIFPDLLDVQYKLFNQLRIPTQDEIIAGIRHAITPLFACHIMTR